MLSHSSTGVPRGAARLEVFPLKAIVGTLEPTIMFDAAVSSCESAAAA